VNSRVGEWIVGKYFFKPLPFSGNGENNKENLFLFQEMAKTIKKTFSFFGKW